MKAILLTAPGSVDCLKLTEIPMPKISYPNGVLIRLKAAGINPVDYKMRQRGGFFPDHLPIILGCDGTGYVEAMGENVTRFKVGDEVYFFNGGIGNEESGNYAEYTVVHQDYLAFKPATLSMAEAASLPLAWITAWESLIDRAQLQTHQTVLIHAGAGGVGYLAIQLAKRLGAQVVTTVSDAAKAQFVRELGADQVINYRDTDFVKACLEWTKGQGVDVCFDTVGGDVTCRSLEATRVYGKLVTLLDLSCPDSAFKLARMRNISLIQELMLTPLYLGMSEARIKQRMMLEEANRLFEQQQLRIHVSQIFPLSEFAQAHHLIEQGHVQGKLVLEI